MAAATPSGSGLRADARRNSEQIRAAAIGAFRGQGLTVPMEEVAKAAGVSKATIFNRFGGRIGLIEAVIEEVVARSCSPSSTARGPSRTPASASRPT